MQQLQMVLGWRLPQRIETQEREQEQQRLQPQQVLTVQQMGCLQQQPKRSKQEMQKLHCCWKLLAL
jgi:hypothetical protein